jgi:hypothetical protein
MKKLFRVTAQAPIGKQILALRNFGTPQQLGKGVFTVNKVFTSEEDAMNYLKGRAELYYRGAELTEVLMDLEMYGSLTIDNVTATIQPVK